ncbi:hypothetical protein JMJ56_09830 [Belnapia sp. T18]|uniref:Uncharacterized protein n=1 Tax=Belnapia arida TaxID=2804533 RepID=A0ABS1U0U5_9PROT|nr:hypothetical protein [Belnapia arida]MBL6078304.1 hypothetical protein [Belnapia arida]
MPSHTQDRPDKTRDANVEAAVEDTFPASDPVGHTAEHGSRAVPAEDMMPSRVSSQAAGLASFTVPFPSQESAKLALETLVREGPVDRRCAEITHEGGQTTLRVSAPEADVARLKSMLENSPSAT